MSREVQQPTVDERGLEHHPAWGLISASRVQCGGGAVLFDSDIKHQHTVRVRLSIAKRQRELNRDWVFADREILEVEMSEAQWASFVSSMNTGSGVPCTIKHRDRQQTPEVPYEPRLRESMAEVHTAGERAVAEVARAFQAYKEHKTVANLRHLEAMIANMPSNLEYAAKSLSEHAENVVQRARADVEAMVVNKARALGLEPGDLGVTLELEEGS